MVNRPAATGDQKYMFTFRVTFLLGAFSKVREEESENRVCGGFVDV
jgi:hypothetical protein